MLVKTNILVKKINGLAKLIYSINENENIPCIEINGEKRFISLLYDYLKNKTENTTKIIFDVGANIGGYSDNLLSISAEHNLNIELHLFEPMHSAITELNKKYKYNTNVYVNKNAITEHEKEIEIYFDNDASPIASLYQRDLSNINVELDKSETIQGIPLYKYISENSIKHIDFIKIDVEGSEVAALKSLREYLNSEFIDFIQFEYGGTFIDSRTYLKDCYDLLVERDFLVGKLLKKGVHIRDYSPDMEYFSYSNYIAISKNCISKL